MVWVMPPIAGPAIIAACPADVTIANVCDRFSAATPAASSGPSVGPTKAFPIPHPNAST